MPEPIDHEYTGDIICPWCGRKQRDPEEFHDGEGDYENRECDSCEKQFSLSVHVTITYTTKREGE